MGHLTCIQAIMAMVCPNRDPDEGVRCRTCSPQPRNIQICGLSGPEY